MIRQILLNISDDQDELEVMQYAMFVIAFNLSILLIDIFFGILFSKLKFTLLFMLFYLPIRTQLGGFHCKKAQTCFIFSILFYICILLIETYSTLFSSRLLLFIIEILSLLLFLAHGKKKNVRKGIVIEQLLFVILVLTHIPINAFNAALSINLILYFL